jgi:hypothetical protein
MFDQIKWLMFYNVQITNLAFVGKNNRYRISRYRIACMIGKIAQLAICFRMILTQIVTHVYKKIPHLDIPTRYQYYTGITILIPTGGFFDTIIYVDY